MLKGEQQMLPWALATLYGTERWVTSLYWNNTILLPSHRGTLYAIVLWEKIKLPHAFKFEVFLATLTKGKLKRCDYIGVYSRWV